jgi:hypothetical protein
MQVTLLIQHSDSWQNIAQIWTARVIKSNLVTYCSEVLGMQYKARALQVDLRGAPPRACLDVWVYAAEGGS